MEGVEMITDNKNFDKICRICLKCDEAKEIEEFKPLLYLLFQKLMDIPEESNANLPKGLCKECKLNLEKISTFIETCKTNQAILKEKYSNGARSKENDETMMNIERGDTFDKELGTNQSNMPKNINIIPDCFEIKQECLDIPKEDIKVTENSKVTDEVLTLNNKNNNGKFKRNDKNVNKMCRVCLKEAEPPDRQEFQPYLYSLFKKLIEIPEKEIVHLPRKICKECKSHLENISMFINTCKANEINLKKMCSNKKHIELISENDTSIEIEIWPNEETAENELNLILSSAKEDDLCPEVIKLEYEDVHEESLDDAECTLLSDVEDESLDHERKDGNNILLLPNKSRQRYELCHKQFIYWLRSKKEHHLPISENVLIEYMQEISQKNKPTSLWTQYSMLRSTLKIYNNLDITNYLRLKALLKRMATGYIPQKAKTLTTEHIQRFITEAPDDKHLFTKTALIIGISGGCNKKELTHLKIDDIEDFGSAAVFKIYDIKSNEPRTFTISGHFYEIFKKYYNLRPPYISERRLFLNYQHEKCTSQAVGINKFGTIPKIVAKYLELNDAELYTAHSFRRTSPSFLMSRTTLGCDK